MSTAPVAPKPAPKAKTASVDGLFWKKYSPHLEFPLSAGASTLVHILIGVLLVLIGMGFINLDRPTRTPPVSTIGIDDGADGTDKEEGGGDSPKPNNTEAVEQPKDPNLPKTPDQVVPDLNITKPDAPTFDLDPNATRFVTEPDVNASKLRDELNKALGQAPSKPVGTTTGQGNGGTGTGSGGTKGDGVGAKAEKRAKRAQRWIMSFNTQSGIDYLRQLSALRAIIAVPADAGNENFIVYRDLKAIPAAGRVEDIKGLNLISWVDENPGSVSSLAQAMGLPQVPRYIVVFFPAKLEEELRSKEATFRGRREEQIKYTKFRAIIRGDTYSLAVIDQK